MASGAGSLLMPKSEPPDLSPAEQLREIASLVAYDVCN
jgi:hypothetical protein